MSRLFRVGWIVLASVMASIAACNEASNEEATVTGSASPSDVPVVGLGDYGSQTFSQSAVIDNEWHPLVPGRHYVYEGKVTEDGERLDHSVEFTVTDLTKVIDGVQTRAVVDRDYVEGELVEYELAFFAQDDDGNVWLMGEYPEEYDGGTFDGAPDTWLTGVDGAQGGVMMRAQPAAGTPSYLQGLWDAIEFKDKAEVRGTVDQVCTPLDCYDDVLLIREWNPDEPQAFQLKYYARGIGYVKVGWAGAKEQEREVLGLVSYEELDEDGLAAVRDEALKLERRAYEVSKAVYGATAPLEQQA
jgi:hypothetical protein